MGYKEKYILLSDYGKKYIKPEDEVIYLNVACLSFQERCAITSQNKNFLPFPQYIDSCEEISLLEDNVYNFIWDNLAVPFSNYHKNGHTKDYWVYFSSFDLSALIIGFYSMYIQIKNALELYGNMKIVCFRDDQYDIARMGNQNPATASYINQLMGLQILESMHYPNLEIKKTYIEKQNIIHIQKEKGIKDILRDIYDKWYLFCTKKSDYFVMYPISENMRKLQISLLKCAYIGNGNNNSCLSDIEINKDGREQLIKFGHTSNEFIELFAQNFKYNCPHYLIESYRQITKENKKLYKLHPSYLIKFLYDVHVMEYASFLLENGTKIIESSHSIEEGWFLYESKVDKMADAHMVWSKKKYAAKKNAVECVSYMSSKIKSEYMCNEDILYARGQEWMPYPNSSIGLRAYDRYDFIEGSKRLVVFYKGLNSDIQRYVVYRNRDEFSEGSRELAEKYCKELSFDDSFGSGRRISFEQKVRTSRLVVVESIMSTSFFQVLELGIPAIIIENTDYTGLLDENVLALLNKLKQVGVWFENPKEAAECVNANYADLASWWEEPVRKEVISEIKNELWVKNSYKNNIIWWKEKIKEIKTIFEKECKET